MVVPVLRMYGDAHRPVEFGGDDVVEDVLRDEPRHGDPVVQSVRPVDASRQPVDGHAVDLRRYARVDGVQRHVVLERHVRRPLSTNNSLPKTAEPIDLPFGLWTRVGRRKDKNKQEYF